MVGTLSEFAIAAGALPEDAASDSRASRVRPQKGSVNPGPAGALGAVQGVGAMLIDDDDLILGGSGQH